MANRTIAAEDKIKKRQAGIIDGRATNHESVAAWGLHGAKKGSPLDALKERLNMEAKLGPSHLGNRVLPPQKEAPGVRDVKMTEGESILQKLENICVAVQSLSAY